jgi:hypothetical protein
MKLTLRLPTRDLIKIDLQQAPDIELLRHKHSLNARREDMERLEYFPCQECCGGGWIYDPNDEPCPIEGNKIRNKLTCPVCKGSRQGDKKDYIAEQKAIAANVKKANSEIRRKVILAAAAFSRIDADEWVAIRELLRNG